MLLMIVYIIRFRAYRKVSAVNTNNRVAQAKKLCGIPVRLAYTGKKWFLFSTWNCRPSEKLRIAVDCVGDQRACITGHIGHASDIMIYIMWAYLLFCSKYNHYFERVNLI